MSLLDIENIRDIRLATKGLMGIPQHFLQDDVQAAFERMGATARERGVDIAVHTHVNCAQQVTPLVGRAARMVLDTGFRDVRNQGVLLRGVNTAPNDLLELCFMLLDHAKIMPYYFYMCDMIPNAEHWRTSVQEAQDLQYQLLGYLPGFATPRVICDVPFVGKRWVHMLKDYDRSRASRTGPRTTARGSSTTTPRRSRASTCTTTRSTRCPRKGRRGGASRSRTASPTRTGSSRRTPEGQPLLLTSDTVVP